MLGKKRLLSVLNRESGNNFKLKDCVYQKSFYGAETLASYPYAVANPHTGILFFQVASDVDSGREFERRVVRL